MRKLLFLLLSAGALCAPSMHAHDASARVTRNCQPRPGCTAVMSVVGPDGRLDRQVVTTPENALMKASKAAYAAGKPVATLRVNTRADADGKNAKPFGVWVIKDNLIGWDAVMQDEAVFTIPCGEYLVQAVYTDGTNTSIFVPVTLDGDMEITLGADMATTSATCRLMTRDGEEVRFPTLDSDWEPTGEPYNVNGLFGMASTVYKGFDRCSNMIMIEGITEDEGGGAAYGSKLAMRTNVTEDAYFSWVMTVDNDTDITGFALWGRADEVPADGIFASHVEDYVAFAPEIAVTPAGRAGAATDGATLGISLVGPDKQSTTVSAGNVKKKLDFYLCVPEADFGGYFATGMLSSIDYYDADSWSTFGITTPQMIRTAGGTRWLCVQDGVYQSSDHPAYSSFNHDPFFDFAAAEGQQFGSTAAYGTSFGQYVSWADTPFYYINLDRYYGNYGEVRGIDDMSTTFSARFNGTPVDLSGVGDVYSWQEAWAADGHEPGVMEYVFTNTNIEVDGIKGSNVLTLVMNERSQDIVPPTLQRLMVVDGAGMPANRFENAADARVWLTGGDFVPQSQEIYMGQSDGLFDFYTYAPADARLEISPRGYELFEEVNLTDDASRFVMPGFGMYWDGCLDGVANKSADGWFDLRVTLTDRSGNSQSQVISPAVYIASLVGETGLRTLEQDASVSLSVAGGSIMASDGSDVDVFTMAGVSVPNRSLAPGFYLARTGAVTRKVIVE